MWTELNANIKRFTGTSGTVTLPKGASIIKILAHATSAGSVAFTDGVGGTVTVVLPASSQWFEYSPQHLACVAGQTEGPLTAIFTSTDSYLLEAYSTTGF